MRDRDSSKSQERALALFGLTADGTYPGAEQALVGAGLNGDGVPTGHTWRTAAKLSDDEIKALLAPVAVDYPDHDAEGPRVVGAPHRPTTQRERQAREARIAANENELHRQRMALKRAGYRFVRNDDYGTDILGGEDWLVVSPEGREMSQAEALAAIGYRR